jgi:alpha-N-arabinofuranosidase
MHASRFGRGKVLRVEPDSPTYEVDGEGAVAAIEATAVLDEAGGALTVFAVNRSGAALPLEVVLRELDGVQLAEHIVLADDDLDAVNTAEQPDRVAPTAGTGAAVEGNSLRAELPARSWNVLRLTGGALA